VRYLVENAGASVMAENQDTKRPSESTNVSMSEDVRKYLQCVEELCQRTDLKQKSSNCDEENVESRSPSHSSPNGLLQHILAECSG